MLCARIMDSAHNQKTALVTGCSSGIGRALAVEFSKRGFRTIATARDTAVLQDLAELHKNIVPASLDLQDHESVRALHSRVTELTGGRLDYLVNNAGLHYASTGLDLDPAKVREVFEVNLIAVMIMVKEFSDHLIASKGVVVQTGSVTRDVPVVWQSPYNATKAALSQYSKTLRLELEPFGVRVVEVVTGYVQSNILRNDLHAPEDSRYLPILNHIQTLKSRGNKTGMPSEVYAKRILDRITKEHPPNEFWEGARAWTLYSIVTFLPTWLAQRLWWWYFKLDTLRSQS